MPDCDLSEVLRTRVAEAAATGTVLRIVGSGSKQFYGNRCMGEPLATHAHAGVVGYEPGELVITARSGTRLLDIEQQLAAHRQMLAWDPPRFGPQATIGGAIATGLSGPRRAYTGAARDYVLGVTAITGRGEIQVFGGRVIKNVAGFDVSRLMTGALGTLGVILEVSLKVLPLPECEMTLVFPCEVSAAIGQMNQLALHRGLSGASHYDGRMYLRFSGGTRSVQAAVAAAGGVVVDDADTLWESLREQTHPFFADDGRVLWRLSLAPATPPLPLPGDWLIEWGGAQRWLKSNAEVTAVRAIAEHHGGHATAFRYQSDAVGAFHPLSPPAARLHGRLKECFDPAAILNRGRLYSTL
ncbi:MAG: glycolate oxidase subunit GlcE [Acidiferrobacteraceae bacterium]